MTSPAPAFVITFKARKASGHFEMDADRCTRLCIVNDIIDGQYEGIDRVLELSEPNGLSGVVGTWRDVTEDLAREARDCCCNEQRPISYPLKSWLHKVLGVMSTRGMLEAA